MKIGNRIKELRTKRGLTQEALASAFGVTPQTVSKWECEVNFPDVSLLPDLSVFFGVTIDSLFSLSRTDRFDRIENRLSESGLLEESEVKQIEAILKEALTDPDGKEDALVLYAELYNHQAEAYGRLAATYSEYAVEASGSDRSMKELYDSHGSAGFGVKDNSHRSLISFLTDYIGRNPDSSTACAMLIDNLIADYRYDEAEKWTTHLEKIDPSYKPLGYRYKISAITGKEDLALAAIAVLANGFSDDPKALMLLADIYMSRNEYEKVISCCRTASDLCESPKSTEPLLVAAHVAELIDRPDEAVSYYREALKILKDEWGIVSGERVDSIRREIKRISTSE